MSLDEEAATINVSGQEVPLPLYWLIVEESETGKSCEEILQTLIQPGYRGNVQLLGELVRNVMENLRLISATVGDDTSEDQSTNSEDLSNVSTWSSASASPHLSTSAKSIPKRVSRYRASRIQAKESLDAAKARLESARDEERRIRRESRSLQHLLTTAGSPPTNQASWKNSEQPLNDPCAIERRLKEYERQHAAVVMEIEKAEEAVRYYKASLK